MSVERRIRFRLATSAAFERAVRAIPGGEDAAWRRARRYVCWDADAALATTRLLHTAGLAASIDLFGEGVTDPVEARAVADAYVALAARLPEAPAGTWLSVDLSHVAFDAALLREIAGALPPGRRLQVGAEEAAVADRVLEAVLGAAAQGLPVDATLQANLRRSAADADRLADAGVGVRLVKGAYVEGPTDALPWGPEVDRAFRELARRLAARGAQVALATHDRALREPLLTELPDASCELLLGVRGDDAIDLARRGRTVRIYVPFGDDWFRYLMRRRAESVGAA